MRALYMKGRLGHTTMVRWLPVSYSRPEAAAQPVDGFSPLQELCSDEGPPFMDAPLQTATPATKKTRRQARRRPGRHIRTGQPLCYYRRYHRYRRCRAVTAPLPP